MIRSIDQMELKGKKVLIRVDYNVPLKNGVIMDDNRIRAAMPTVQYALDQGAALILCSHMGKPKGQVVPELSLKPVAVRLAELLGREVKMAPSCLGPEVEAMAAALKPGDILLLENSRFQPGELKGDAAMGKAMAGLCDIYCCDAFGTAHRANATMVDIPAHAKQKCAGFLMMKEYKYLEETLADPKRPYVAISGGAKASTKIGILENLLPKVDKLILGGAMANTFFLAQGHGVGKSLAEPEQVEQCLRIQAEADRLGVDLLLPVDCVLADSADAQVSSGTVDVDSVPDDAVILDAGPKSVARWAEKLKGAGTVVWNGPVGLFETTAFAEGSKGLAEAVVASGAVSIIGGGDTGACLKLAGLSDKVTFISTGGGSFLEFMEGKELPGFKALEE